jgi:hypothetical protein
MEETRALLDKYGFTETESILNEWNYVRGWLDDDWVYSLKAEKGLKGAAFTAAVMCEGQEAPLDMLMYYDARPCGMNGMFSTDFVCEALKGYYPFKAFGELYRMGTSVKTETENDLYAVAAKKGDEAAIMAVRFNDDDSAEDKKVKIEISGVSGVTAEYYLLDENHDLELVREEIFGGDTFRTVLNFSKTSVYLIKLKKTEI